MIGMQVTPVFRVEEEAGSEHFSPSCVVLLQEYEKHKSEKKQEFEKQKRRKRPELFVGKLLRIDGGAKFADMDFYNPSGSFEINGKTCICIRAESPKTCEDSRVFLLEKGKDGVWRPVINSFELSLEDGFCVPIGPGTIIVGAVKAYPKPTAEHPDKIDYHMVFYWVSHLGCEFAFKEFTRGPDGMKGIRFVFLKNGKVGVVTRPQGLQPDGRNCGRGEIAYIELNSLDDMTPENLLKARVIENQFAPGEWGGPNQLFILPYGRIGVLGHIAYRDEAGNRHYYVMAFVYDTEAHKATPIKIIAARDDFPPGKAKFPDLHDVVYPGGMTRDNKGRAIINVGLGDAQAAEKIIFDPFCQKELMTNEQFVWR